MAIPDKKLLSAQQYARRVGVSRQAVYEAIRNGRLVKSVVREELSERLLIDPSIADKEWGQNRGYPGRPRGEDVDPADLTASRAKKEAYQAEIFRLKSEQLAGRLVDAEKVKREAFKTARMVRDGLGNLPDRLAAQLAAETDQFKVHRLLTEEVRKALEALGRDLELAPDDEDEGEADGGE